MENAMFYAAIARDSYDDVLEREGYETKFFSKRGSQSFLLTSDANQILVFRGTEKNEWLDLFASMKLYNGFEEYTEHLWWDIIKHIDYSKSIVITGHSLGGAIACIFASWLDQTKDITLYTFGSPRVGDKKFVKNLKITHYRWVNAFDIATITPFYPYRHHGHLNYVCADGTCRNLTMLQRILDRIKGGLYRFKQHSIDTYVENIKLNRGYLNGF